MIHIHHLAGCAPTPLAHYLKALGVLRLVSEQVDSDARGWWEGDRFLFATILAVKELKEFFLRDYEPTPMFNPWGARSGYFNGTSETSARRSLKQIEIEGVQNTPRLAAFVHAIKVIREVVSKTTNGKKPSNETKKSDLILALRSKLRGTSTSWLETVVSIIGTGSDVNLGQPPIFGTGGNEGSGGYPSAYMSAIVEAVIEQKWDHAIHGTLFGASTKKYRWGQSMGQFMPGGASTPWDLILAFEGGCVLRSTVASRTAKSEANARWMSSPFYVAPRSAGYASGSRLDERFLNKGRENPGRGEQWLPMWEKPSRYSEIRQIFLHGRAATKAGNRATDGWNMALAVHNFGIARGITRFIRYGYQQRNNQATHYAIPLGLFHVPDRPSGQSSCVDDLGPWLRSLHRIAHPAGDQEAKRTPSCLTLVYRRLQDSLFSLVQSQHTPQEWQEALLRMGEVEAIIRRGSGFSAGPIPRLRPEWVAASDDGRVEFRLALAFALQRGFHRQQGSEIDPPIRRHWLPLDRKRPGRFATDGTDNSAVRLKASPEVVMHGRRGVDDAIALVERRIVEESQHSGRHLPLQAAHRSSTSVGDLTALLTDRIDLNQVMTLARPLMALDRNAWDKHKIVPTQPPKSWRDIEWPDESWLAVRLCMLPWPIRTRSGFDLDIGADPAIIRRLAAGDAASAVAIALRRLNAAGVRSTVRFGAVPPDTARLWAAAIAFPISKGTAKQFLSRLDPSKE